MSPRCPLYFNERKLKEHKHTYGKTMSVIIKVIIPAWWIGFSMLWDSLAWRRRRLLLAQGVLGGLQVAVAPGSGFGGRFGASLWVLAVLYVSHSFHIAAAAHPSTRDLCSFAPATTQTCPVPQWDLDYENIFRLLWYSWTIQCDFRWRTFSSLHGFCGLCVILFGYFFSMCSDDT